MKRLLVLILVWTLLVVTGTIVSADGQTRHRHKSKNEPQQSVPAQAQEALIFTRVTRVASVITNVTN